MAKPTVPRMQAWCTEHGERGLLIGSFPSRPEAHSRVGMRVKAGPFPAPTVRWAKAVARHCLTASMTKGSAAAEEAKQTHK
mmetsp:Transcript_102600/g.319742  ORF Transcript_102600/g.319742 Transcript_102600/m.319742 type:complete len:81 (+) Transcript_102600:87-329(+)